MGDKIMNLRISEELHHRIKMLSATKKSTIRSEVIKAIEEFLEKEEKK